MSFNIDKIIKECPRAWEEFVDYLEIPAEDIERVTFAKEENQILIDGFLIRVYIHFRTLYDFFDSVGIKISIQYDNTYEYWDGKIITNNVVTDIEMSYKDRKDTEYLAIPKAFEIYEKQLKEV